MSKSLPIDQAPKAPSKIEEPLLSRLNAALYRAQLKDQECRTLAAHQQLATLAARAAAADFDALRRQVSAELGVQLGASHDWRPETGEVVEAARQRT